MDNSSLMLENSVHLENSSIEKQRLTQVIAYKNVVGKRGESVNVLNSTSANQTLYTKSQ
jgi:hypothetical protein